VVIGFWIASDFGTSSPKTMCRIEMMTKAMLAEIEWASAGATAP
jgi:hypothetical protein